MAGSLDPQGPVAGAMAGLWWLMLGLGTAVLVLVLVLLVRGLRRGDSPEDDEALTRRWLIRGGVALPLVVLVVVLAATLGAMRSVPGEAPDGALVVELVGHQWWWEVRYPDHGITTANEVHMPVGTPVAFRVTSADVIHSFWVPALGGKIDMLPDGVNTMVLEADVPGRHRSQCAEFCGLQHARMGMVVLAEESEDFAEWVRAQQQPTAEPTTAAEQQGREVFLGADCVRCHGVDGGAGVDGPAPDLTHVASRLTLAAGVLDNTPAELRRWLRDPLEVKPGVDMPVPDLTDDQLDALVAYLAGLG